MYYLVCCITAFAAWLSPASLFEGLAESVAGIIPIEFIFLCLVTYLRMTQLIESGFFRKVTAACGWILLLATIGGYLGVPDSGWKWTLLLVLISSHVYDWIKWSGESNMTLVRTVMMGALRLTVAMLCIMFVFSYHGAAPGWSEPPFSQLEHAWLYPRALLAGSVYFLVLTLCPPSWFFSWMRGENQIGRAHV